MPSTYSKNLGLELIATGEQAGTWGDTTNKNMAALDDSIDGIVDVIVGTDGFTLVTNDVPAISAGRSKIVNLTGFPNPNAVITIAPSDVEKWYYVRNATGQPLRFQQGTGSTYTVAAGYSAVIHCDGVGIAASVFGTLLSLQVNRLLVRVDAAIPGSGAAVIEGTATITGGVTLSGAVTAASLTVTGATSLQGTLGVVGAVTFSEAAVTIGGPTQINNALGVTGTLSASGAVNLGPGAVVISAPVTIHSSLAVQSVSVTLGGLSTTALTASGATTLAGATATSLVVSGATETGSFTCHGQANIAGIAVTTLSVGNLTVSGATSLNTLGVAGAATLAGTTISSLAVSGSISVAGNVDCTGSVISRAAMYIEAGVYIKVGADATYDMYFREGPGYLARLPAGAAGQILRTASGGWPYWATPDPPPAPSLPVGSPIPGGVAADVLYVDINGNLGRGYLSFAYWAGQLNVIGAAGQAASVVLSGQVGSNLEFQKAGTSYWKWSLFPWGEEALVLIRNTTQGGAINFAVLRENGHILMGGPTGADIGGMVNIQPLAASDIPLIIRRKPGQTGNLIVSQDENGTPMSWMTPSGVWQGASANANFVTMNKSTSYSLGSNVNVGALFFYAPTLGGAGGYLSFQYGLGGTGGSVYIPLPVTGGTGITTGLTWMYRNGGNAPLAQTFEEYRHDSALGIVDNILAHADVLEKLKVALSS